MNAARHGLPAARRWRSPLVLRVVVAYLSVTTLLMGLLVWALAVRQRTALMEELEKRAGAVSRLFVRDLVAPLYRLDVLEIVTRIESLRHLDDVEDVVVFDEKGRIITDGSIENARLGDRFPDLGDLLAKPRPDPDLRIEQGRLEVQGAVILAGKSLGGTRVTFTLGGVDSQVRALTERGVAVSIFLMLLGIVPVVVVTQFVVKPFFLGSEG